MLFNYFDGGKVTLVTESSLLKLSLVVYWLLRKSSKMADHTWGIAGTYGGGVPQRLGVMTVPGNCAARRRHLPFHV